MNLFQFLTAFGPIIALLLGGLGWLYRHEKERRLAIERQLSDSKYSTYSRLISAFLGLLHAEDKEAHTKQIEPQLAEIHRDLIFYGSDSVISKYGELRNAAKTGKLTIDFFGELLVEIRRDMGNKNTRIQHPDANRLFIANYDEHKQAEQAEAQSRAGHANR